MLAKHIIRVCFGAAAAAFPFVFRVIDVNRRLLDVAIVVYSWQRVVVDVFAVATFSFDV